MTAYHPISVASPSNHMAVVVVKTISANGNVENTVVGSGAIVGRNEILTAAHVVQPPSGGRIAQIAVYPEGSVDSKKTPVANPMYKSFTGKDITNLPEDQADWQVRWLP